MRFLLCLLLVACSSHEPKEPEADARLVELRDLFAVNMAEAESLRDPVNGWLTPTDCDGTLWQGKFAAVSGVKNGNLEAAEIEPGRFVRRPAPLCTSDNPAWSDWSRDMFAGLTAYAWRHRDVAALERHLSYGRDHNWIMGKPFGDGRSVYLPATYGRLYQTIFALGGVDDPKRFWPDVYPAGLTDYQAHMQMMNIWLRAEIGEGSSGDARPAGKQDDVGSPQANLNSVDDTQLDRIKEHAAREPNNPFFQAVAGSYSGDMGPAISVLLDPAMPVGEYVRCDEFRRCQLAEWLFAADLVLRRYRY